MERLGKQSIVSGHAKGPSGLSHEVIAGLVNMAMGFVSVTF